MRKNYYWFIAAILWCIAIFIATTSPVSTGGNTLELFRKYLQLSEGQATMLNLLFRKGTHLTAFGMLAVFLYKSFIKRRFFLAWLFTMIYAATDELHQAFVPNRDGLFIDVIIDSVGALLALFIIKLIGRKRKTR